MKNLFAIFLTFFTLLFVGAQFGQNFQSKINLLAGSGPYNVISADFNGDNIPDIAAVNLNDSTVSFWVNITKTDDSLPRYSHRIDVKVPPNPIQLAAGDFNLDGKMDLAVASGSNGTVIILSNATTPLDTNLSFVQATSLPAGTLPSSVAVADLDLDGYPDVVSADMKNNSLNVFLNTKSFTFKKFSFATGKSPQAIKIGDLNNDNLPDILVANKTDKTISVFYHGAVLPGNSFELLKRQEIGNQTEFRGVDIGDINMDGYPDIFAASVADSSLSFFLFDPATKKFSAD